MTNYPYILFNKSPEQLRQIGARGSGSWPERKGVIACSSRTRLDATSTVEEEQANVIV